MPVGATNSVRSDLLPDLRIAAHGVPQRLLSDKGAALNPTVAGAGQLVAYVTALGVEPIT
jgi:putative transposase